MMRVTGCVAWEASALSRSPEATHSNVIANISLLPSYSTEGKNWLIAATAAPESVAADWLTVEARIAT